MCRAERLAGSCTILVAAKGSLICAAMSCFLSQIVFVRLEGHGWLSSLALDLPALAVAIARLLRCLLKALLLAESGTGSKS